MKKLIPALHIPGLKVKKISQNSLKYSSNKIRNTQNDHLIIICQNLIGLYS